MAKINLLRGRVKTVPLQNKLKCPPPAVARSPHKAVGVMATRIMPPNMGSALASGSPRATRIVAAASDWWPFHDDESGALQMPDNAIGDNRSMYLSESWTRFLPLNSSAKAIDPARS
jgi:hypothetical protein